MGGWSNDGRTKYTEYVAMNKAARKLASTQVLEATFVNRLRNKYNITCNDHKTQSNLERSNKQKRKLDRQRYYGWIAKTRRCRLLIVSMSWALTPMRRTTMWCSQAYPVSTTGDI